MESPESGEGVQRSMEGATAGWGEDASGLTRKSYLTAYTAEIGFAEYGLHGFEPGLHRIAQTQSVVLSLCAFVPLW